MQHAAKRESSLTASLTALRFMLLLVVSSCGLETRVSGFAAAPQLASGQIALATPSFIGEIYDAPAYDASDSLVAAKNVTKEIKVRPTPGRDGATSTHIIERVDGRVNSVTHQVTKDGKLLHQHQTHVGKHGTERRFPDEWIEYPTIPKE